MLPFRGFVTTRRRGRIADYADKLRKYAIKTGKLVEGLKLEV